MNLSLTQNDALTQAVIAVVTVNDPVECLRHHHHYFPPAYLLYSESISHLLLLINSSINFLIYCVVVSVTLCLVLLDINLQCKTMSTTPVFEKTHKNFLFFQATRFRIFIKRRVMCATK